MAACSSAPTTPEVTRTDRARMYVEAANGALLEGDYVGALQSLAQAEAQDSSLPEIYHSKALAYYGKHDLPTAISLAKKAVQILPTFSDANNTLGKMLIDAGRFEEAEPPLQTAAKDPLYRESYKPLTNLGIIYYRKGQYARSKEYLDRATESAPVAACIAYYYSGHIALHNSKFHEAIKDYDLATRKSCASFADAHLALGIAYEQSKQYDRARKKFLEIQQRYPDSKVAEQAVKHLRYLP